MIKATGTFNGKNMVFLGLSHGNLAYLMDGKPIHIKGEAIGVPFDILIHGGKTEEAILVEMKRLGIVTDQTKQA